MEREKIDKKAPKGGKERKQESKEYGPHSIRGLHGRIIINTHV